MAIFHPGLLSTKQAVPRGRSQPQLTPPPTCLPGELLSIRATCDIKTMRPGRGCKSCRKKHAKCITEDGASACVRCIDSGHVCDFEPRIRFKEVKHVDAASKGPGVRVELSFEEDQVWVSTNQPCEFSITKLIFNDLS